MRAPIGTGAEQREQAVLGEIDCMDRDAERLEHCGSRASIISDNATICDFGTQICSSSRRRTGAGR
jgi:hypothetical protein